MRRAIEKWVAYKLNNGNWKPRTAKKALQWSYHFAQDLEERYHITSLHQINQEVMTRYRREKFPEFTQDGRYRAQEYLSDLFNWCVQHELLLVSPLIPWQRIRRPAPALRFLSLEQIQTILQSLDTSTPQGIQRRTVIEIFYATAIRQNELLQLNLDHIDISKRTLLVERGKNDKSRLLPVIPSAVRWLREHLEKSRPHLVRDLRCSALFVGKTGLRIGPVYITKLMKKLRQTTGIKPISAHVFRHSCATHLMNAGVALSYIQRFLGHEKLETTQRYLQILSEEVYAQYTLAHPRDRFEIEPE